MLKAMFLVTVTLPASACHHFTLRNEECVHTLLAVLARHLGGPHSFLDWLPGMFIKQKYCLYRTVTRGWLWGITSSEHVGDITVTRIVAGAHRVGWVPVQQEMADLRERVQRAYPKNATAL